MDILKSIKTFWNGESDEVQDKAVILSANAKTPPAKKPKKVNARAKHAGMVYNPSIAEKPGSEIYTQPEYDMTGIANCIDTDSLFRRAVEKYVELIWKSEYKFVGRNINAVKYLRKRLEQIAMVTNTPTDELFRQISYQIVTYSNAYVSKVRDDSASGGSYRRTFTGQVLAPVAGYFVEDTVSMELAVKKNGDPIGYKQQIPGMQKKKIWRPWNMIHMYYSRKPGLRVGTPLVWPVLDDIRALRKMEQNVELLVFQHALPLYQYKIGTAERPGQDDEISAMQSEIQRMPPNGAIVTPERHEVVAIGAEKKALDVEKYLGYFKGRIIAGLGMSSVGMGDGGTANRGTAQVVDKHMHNTTETFQKIIAMFINDFIIKELLAEGGYTYDAIDDDNKVSLFFPPVDKEEQRSRENHLAQMYTQHTITETEMRQDGGRDPLKDEDREDMYFNRVEAPLAIIQAVDEDYPEDEVTKTTTTNNGNTQTKTVTKSGGGGTGGSMATKKTATSQGVNGANASGANKEQPQNQHGKKTAKPTHAKNDEIYDNLHGVLEATKNDVIDTYIEYIDSDEYSIKYTSNIRNYVFVLSKSDMKSDDRFLTSMTDKLMDDLSDKIIPMFDIENKYEGVAKISSIFESSKHKLDSLCSVAFKEGEIDG